MAPLPITGSDPTILQDLKKELADVEAALKELLSNGQEYSIVGSHSFKGVQYAELRRERNSLRARILAMNGGRSHVRPDFGGPEGVAIEH
jgi:hypothetical protein